MLMNEAEIIYLEVDAEITEAIDKLKSAKGDAVKVVVPARSTLLQSAVNLKLLKKAAKDHGKELALVTNDKTATYLAGGVGLAVASSLKAEPKVPEAIEEAINPDIVEPEPEESSTASKDGGKSSSSSSGSKDKSDKSDKASAATEEAGVSKRALGDEEIDEDRPAGKKAKVPNYNAFQKKLWIGMGVFMGILLAVILAITLPTAKLTVIAKADKLPIKSDFVLDTSGVETNVDALTFAGNKLTLQKDLTQNFTATGKKDVGTKAAGNVTISNASNSDPITIAAGTVLSSQGKNFSLNSATTVPGAKLQGGNIVAGKVTAAITATANGDSYNLGTTTFTVVGYNDKVTASGSTSGGTSKTVTIVSQSDVDSAKQQAIDAAANGSKDELLDKATDKDVVFDDTFATTTDSVSSSVAVGSEAESGTVTVKVTYSVAEAKKETMDKLLDSLANDAMPDGNQQLYQNGSDSAKYSLLRAVSDNRYRMNVAADAYYGKRIDKSQIAKDTAGKAKKDVTAAVQKNNPSVTGTQIESTPSLMPNMPALSSHITVVIRVNTE